MPRQLERSRFVLWPAEFFHARTTPEADVSGAAPFSLALHDA